MQCAGHIRYGEIVLSFAEIGRRSWGHAEQTATDRAVSVLQFPNATRSPDRLSSVCLIRTILANIQKSTPGATQ